MLRFLGRVANMKSTRQISALLGAALMSACVATVPDDLDENDGPEVEVARLESARPAAEPGTLRTPTRLDKRAVSAGQRNLEAPRANRAGSQADGAGECVPPWDPAWQEGDYSNAW